MQIDAPETRRVLERMVARLTSQRTWHEDLVQEALLHLWLQELRCPGQSAFWYLRSCEFHVRNQMRRGRSIDSPKRYAFVVLDGKADPNGFLDSLVDATSAASVLQTVIARDLLSVVKQNLTAPEQDVLACLLEGLGARETARRLNLSHTCVAKRRRRIAAVVMELEPETHTNGTAQSKGANRAASPPSRRSKRTGSRFQFDARITLSIKPKNRVGRATINTILS